MINAYFNWSSGKDSAMALYYAEKYGKYDIRSLFTIIKKEESKIAMHEISIDLLRRQIMYKTFINDPPDKSFI